MVFSTDLKKIYRLEGTPDGTTWPGTALNSNFFNLSMITNGVSVSSSDSIAQIASMEYYGLFVNIVGKKYFIEIEPTKIMDKNTNGTLKFSNSATSEHAYTASTLKFDGSALTDTTKTLGIRERSDAVSICTGSEFKFAQTQGEMSMHRPVYMICAGIETTIYRVTTVINKFFSIPATHPTFAWTKLWTYPL